LSKKLTTEEKKIKRQELDLIHTRNKVLVNWATKKLHTYADLLKEVGADSTSIPLDQLSKALDKPTIMAFFQSYLDKLTLPTPVVPVNGNKKTVTLKTNAEAIEEDDKLAEHEKLPVSPNQACSLFAFQERAAAALYYGIIDQHKRGQLLRAAVGTGKTFIIGALCDRLRNINYCKGKTFSPWPVLYVTRASIVEQTKRVLKEQFNLDIVNGVRVINIEQLRTSLGELMVRAETIVENGEEKLKWVWREGIHPLIVLWDECQALKNLDSQQSQIGQAFNDIKGVETIQVFFSATPYMRICEAKCFTVATRLRTSYGLVTESYLTNHNWNSFAKAVAHPAEPEEYSPAAMKRLMDIVNPFIVDVKGVRPQFNARNRTELIQFATQEEHEFYHKAWERYEQTRQKILGYQLSAGQSAFLILAQFTVFRKAAELCRAPYLARKLHEAVLAGKAACLAVNFKGTIRRVVQILCDEYGVSRDQISLIWGGGKTKKTKKQENKELVLHNDFMREVMTKFGLDEKMLGVEDVEEYVDDDPTGEISDKYRLGVQSKVERQKEIDRFQKGKSLYCMFTFKAGGVGLSLHHTDEMTKFKCRRKRNNWIVSEDVVNVPTRQRICYLAPTFSAIELVQGLGRCPRLTSLSDTEQIVVFYEGTIEERVAALVSQKLKCLRQVVRQRESWESVIRDNAPMKDSTTIIDNRNDDEEDNGLIGDVDDEDDE